MFRSTVGSVVVRSHSAIASSVAVEWFFEAQHYSARFFKGLRRHGGTGRQTGQQDMGQVSRDTQFAKALSSCLRNSGFWLVKEAHISDMRATDVYYRQDYAGVTRGKALECSSSPRFAWP